MAGLGKTLRAHAGPVSDVVPGAAPIEGAAGSEHVVADIGMGPAHAVCGGGDSVDGLGEAAAVAPAAGDLELALQPPVVNNLMPQGGAIALDLNGRRWRAALHQASLAAKAGPSQVSAGCLHLIMS